MVNLSERVIYEDEEILAINKPAGLLTHADGRTDETSVSEWFLEKYPNAKDVGEKLGDIAKPGIVHRIDRETSGILLLAKTKEGHAYLKEQFQNREIEKIYHLFVYGNVKEDRGTINLPIMRSKSDFRKRVAKRMPRFVSFGGVFRKRNESGEGREAITHFQVLKRTEDKSLSFVEARPKTGRTHQIRAHFQAQNNPVVCDNLYAPKKPCLLGFKRLALHARAISFRNTKGEIISIEAEYPEDFKVALKGVGFEGKK